MLDLHWFHEKNDRFFNMDFIDYHLIFQNLDNYFLCSVFSVYFQHSKALISNSKFSCSFVFLYSCITRCMHLAKNYCRSMSSAVTDHLLCHRLHSLSSDWGALLFLYSYLHSGMFGEQMSHVTWPLRAMLALGFVYVCVCTLSRNLTTHGCPGRCWKNPAPTSFFCSSLWLPTLGAQPAVHLKDLFSYILLYFSHLKFVNLIKWL